MTRLENWIFVNRTDLYGNNYQKLIGNVYGHSMQNEDTGELCDGNNIITSKLVHFDVDNMVAITQSGTVYELGVKAN